MGTAIDFWRDQAAWPRDTPDMVFLARAVDQLARCRLGAEWTGEEFTAEPLKAVGLTTDDRTINNIIAQHLPRFGRREYRGSLASAPIGEPPCSPPKFDISIPERRAASEFIEQHNAKVADAIKRFNKVQTAFADYAIAGKLGTAFRAVAGGDFHSIPATWWSTERLEQRFAYCRINPDDPFAAAGRAFIFVSRFDLERVATPGTRGAPVQYDWDEGKQFVFKILRENGDFAKPENKVQGWRSQNDVVKLLLRHMSDFGDGEPSVSGAKDKVKHWLEEWRRGENT